MSIDIKAILCGFVLGSTVLWSVGCTTSQPVSVESWQADIDVFLATEANGDPAALTSGPKVNGWHVFEVRGGAPEGAQRITGVLLGHRLIDNKSTFIYLLGIGTNETIRDVRLATAQSTAGKLRWKIGAKREAENRNYLGERKLESRDGTPYRQWPDPKDRFELKITGNTLTVIELTTKTQWELTLGSVAKSL